MSKLWTWESNSNDLQPTSILFLVEMPFVTSSFLLLVAMPGATSINNLTVVQDPDMNGFFCTINDLFRKLFKGQYNHCYSFQGWWLLSKHGITLSHLTVDS